ncbi:MAG: CvpA family protein [Planctomycetota bacterium]
MLFGLIIGFTVFAAFAMFVREGLWSNTIALIQIMISGLIAFCFYPPLTVLVDEQTDGQYTFLLDIVMLWAIYCVTLVVLKIVTESLSKKRMAFVPEQLDDFAGPLVGLAAGVLLAGFVGASLHLAPLPRDGLGNGMNYKPGELRSAPLYALDVLWLNVVEGASAAGFGGSPEFSAEEFVSVYGDRRETYERAPGMRVERAGGRANR